ncbi:MAG: hypothetical protein CVU05_14020 [Bacteroidetes bacterium HGW-Bacteroidetes-21]|jgi:hypothetical protein|nr:MAG: hypothetical protein CVU05_14020 [Bacteroidetes bacterium HGW-Bacteroidetes-21]
MKITLIISLIFVLLSCKKKPEENPVPVSADQGFFIVNEGNYTWGNASLSFYNENTNEIQNQVFYRTNNVPLGDVAMSMTIANNKGFIVVNNSGRIYVINPSDYTHLGSITGLVSPRQILQLNNNTALVSDLYDNHITLFDPTSLSKTGSIDVGYTTESFALSSNKIFITCWSYNNRVLVMDATTLTITDTIIVGKQPRWIQTDKNGNVWTLCDGGFPGSPAGYEAPSFYCINATNSEILKRIDFPSAQYATYGFDMNKTKDSLYFIRNGISKMAITDTVFPTTQLISGDGKNFYQVVLHPSKDELIVTNAANFSSDGFVYVYSLSGQLLHTAGTGINPGNICFKE